MRIIKAAAVFCAVLMSASLCACERVIRGPADELTMFSWSSTFDNGNKVSLSFDSDSAVFSAQGDGLDLDISGYCLVGDDSFVICDDDTGFNYRFGYIVHGDSVELSYDGGSVALDKIG